MAVAWGVWAKRYRSKEEQIENIDWESRKKNLKKKVKVKLHGKAIGKTKVRELEVGKLNLGNQVRGTEHDHNLNSQRKSSGNL